MTKEKARLMSKVTGMFAEVAAQLFGEDTRVEFILNIHDKSRYHLSVGPIGEYDEFYDFEGEDWVAAREDDLSSRYVRYSNFLKEADDDLDG